MATDAEILSAIDTAIVDILENGQRVMFDGSVYEKANISELWKVREKYVGKTTASSDTFFSRTKTIIPRRC